MKGQSLNANIVSIALVGFIALFLVIVPIRIEFGVPETAAQYRKLPPRKPRLPAQLLILL